MPRRPAIVAFDVIETLFPLEPLGKGLEALGLPAHVLPAWFAAGLRDAFALAVTGGFRPLREILDANLDDLLARHGRQAAPDARAALLDSMATLPPHHDAGAALAMLRDGGVRVFAVSNGAASATESLLRHADLRGYVERVVSVDAVRCSKPARELYAHVVELAGTTPDSVLLAATHPWDCHGAAAAGLLSGFVARGRPFPPTMRQPDLVADSLASLATAILHLPG